jgi:hypothetical protein
LPAALGQADNHRMSRRFQFSMRALLVSIRHPLSRLPEHLISLSIPAFVIGAVNFGLSFIPALPALRSHRAVGVAMMVPFMVLCVIGLTIELLHRQLRERSK